MTRAMIIRSLFVAIILILLHSDCLAQGKDIKNILSIQNRLDRIESNLTEIRRDQVNYKIEKDLLKETFSSNYQTIIIVLTIVLGLFTAIGFLFTLIGFLGIRDISAIKKEYSAELEKINALRKDLEIKVSKIGEEQEKVKSDYLEIIKTNEEQSRRIKVLELQEKISSLMLGGNYERALEYSIVGLNLDPHNTLLLMQKAKILWKINDLDGAVTLFIEALKEDPGNKAAITDLLELFLLLKRIQDYDELYSKNKFWVDQKNDFTITMYFNILKTYQLGQQEQLEKLTREYFEKLPAEKKCYTTGWDFTDVLSYLKPQPDSRAKTLLTAFISFIKGEIEKADALKVI